MKTILKRLLLSAAIAASLHSSAFAALPKPTYANVAYGEHPKQVVDFYRAESDKPTPVIFHMHGGGWMTANEDHLAFNPDQFLREGISVVSVGYRLIPEAMADGVEPPVKASLHDAARALQFVRSKAKEWNIDKMRIAATGGDAGGFNSLWLAFHDDMAQPDAVDVVARESTRLLCAGVFGAQTSLDAKQMKAWIPNILYGGHAFGYYAVGRKNYEEFDLFIAGREKNLPWIKEYSPYELVTADDPPVFLYYGTAPAMGRDQRDPNHSANFGVALEERCKAQGVTCRLTYAGVTDPEYTSYLQYLIRTLKAGTYRND